MLHLLIILSDPKLNRDYLGSIWESLLIAFVATIAMTIFSAIVSRFEKKNFIEPELLSKVIKSWFNDFGMPVIYVMAYTLHFIVGWLFTMVHMYYYQFLIPIWYNALLLGFINGLVGVATWALVIFLHKQVLKVHVRKYLWQLLFAHIVFALVILYMFKTARFIS